MSFMPHGWLSCSTYVHLNYFHHATLLKLNCIVDPSVYRCGHCKHLAPIYEKLASVFKQDDSVVIANLDADKHTDLAKKYAF
ncbi:hypothetical protein Zm00014a_038390 [Zea mays]|uniref:Thioredoxin domain-containing protein n=1 Tax=Zea mays TaxID=4577 RepID=A0A3L6ESL5_MAIZE|nr:hypothetical protein Zm00014a_038390 [Zea mays]